jgi:hypothetical protein
MAAGTAALSHLPSKGSFPGKSGSATSLISLTRLSPMSQYSAVKRVDVTMPSVERGLGDRLAGGIIDDFRTKLRGLLLRPDSNGYDDARRVWNRLTLSRHPARATARRLPPSIESRAPPVAG